MDLTDLTSVVPNYAIYIQYFLCLVVDLLFMVHKCAPFLLLVNKEKSHRKKNIFDSTELGMQQFLASRQRNRASVTRKNSKKHLGLAV